MLCFVLSLRYRISCGCRDAVCVPIFLCCMRFQDWLVSLMSAVRERLLNLITHSLTGKFKIAAVKYRMIISLFDNDATDSYYV